MRSRVLKIYLLAGLILFCVPHFVWNNLYAALYALVGLGIYLFACRKEGVPLFSPRILGWGMPAFLLLCLISALWAGDRAGHLRVAVFYFTGFLLAYLTARAFTPEKDFRTLFLCLHLVLLITSLHGLMDYIWGEHIYFTEVGGKILTRLCSTLEHPNNYGEFTALLFPLCLAAALQEPEKKRRIVRLVLFLPALAALALTFSRTGWVAFAVSLVIFVWIKNKKWLLPLLGLGVLAVLLSPADIRARLLSMFIFSDASSSGRFTLWKECLPMLKDHWLPGIGLGTENFASAYEGYSSGSLWFSVPHSNMLYLDVFLSLGIAGFAAFCAFFFGCFRTLRSGKDRLAGFAPALAASLAGFAVASVFEQTFFYPRVLFAWCIVYGISCAGKTLLPKNSMQVHK